MDEPKKKSIWSKLSAYLPNAYYITAIASLLFILVQAIYAKRSIVETNSWEKAKLTIENITTFKENISQSPLFNSKVDILYKADHIWPDFSVAENYVYADSLLALYGSLFSTIDERMEEDERLMSALDAFAYPIVMGYASESSSHKSSMGSFYLLSNYIMPIAYRSYPYSAPHAKLLYKLWRPKTVKLMVDSMCEIDTVIHSQARLKVILGEEPTVEALKRYSKQLSKEIKNAQKAIEKLRAESLE